MSSATPLADCIKRVSKITQNEQEIGVEQKIKKNTMVVVGRGRRLAAENHHDELKSILSNNKSTKAHVGGDARKTLGDVGAAFVISGPSDASILVMQSAHNSKDV